MKEKKRKKKMCNVFGLRDQDYSSMIIAGIKFIVVIMVKCTYKLWIYIYGSRRKVLVSSIMGLQVMKARRVKYM